MQQRFRMGGAPKLPVSAITSKEPVAVLLPSSSAVMAKGDYSVPRGISTSGAASAGSLAQEPNEGANEPSPFRASLSFFESRASN